MLDLRTLLLTHPLDRYEASPARRRAERAVFALLRPAPAGVPAVRDREEVQVH